jgi:hypothetical protein
LDRRNPLGPGSRGVVEVRPRIGGFGPSCMGRPSEKARPETWPAARWQQGVCGQSHEETFAPERAHGLARLREDVERLAGFVRATGQSRNRDPLDRHDPGRRTAGARASLGLRPRCLGTSDSQHPWRGRAGEKKRGRLCILRFPKTRGGETHLFDPSSPPAAPGRKGR